MKLYNSKYMITFLFPIFKDKLKMINKERVLY